MTLFTSKFLGIGLYPQLNILSIITWASLLKTLFRYLSPFCLRLWMPTRWLLTYLFVCYLSSETLSGILYLFAYVYWLISCFIKISDMQFFISSLFLFPSHAKVNDLFHWNLFIFPSTHYTFFGSSATCSGSTRGWFEGVVVGLVLFWGKGDRWMEFEYQFILNNSH